MWKVGNHNNGYIVAKSRFGLIALTFDIIQVYSRTLFHAILGI